VPRDEEQRSLKSLDCGNCDRDRSAARTSGGPCDPLISQPLLVIVVFWLVIIFLGFSVISPTNLTAGLTLPVTALSVTAAVFLIHELDQPFVGLGSRYGWSKDVTLGGAYELAWGGDLDVDLERGPLSGRVTGTYENVAIHFVSLNPEWRF